MENNEATLTVKSRFQCPQAARTCPISDFWSNCRPPTAADRRRPAPTAGDQRRPPATGDRRRPAGRMVTSNTPNHQKILPPDYRKSGGIDFAAFLRTENSRATPVQPPRTPVQLPWNSRALPCSIVATILGPCFCKKTVFFKMFDNFDSFV